MSTIEDGGTWGILGGAFDPIHNGHLNLAERVLSKKNLSGILFALSYQHPCKKLDTNAPYKDRVAMLKLALEPYTIFHLCEIEAEQKLTGYTLDTVRALKSTYSKAEFRFIIGSDNLSQLPSWYKLHELMDEIIFLVGARPGFELKSEWQFSKDSLELISIEPVDVSSSLIRQYIREDVSDLILDRLLPKSVREYILSRDLYR
ncbi:MAG: nicotinate (nicotinamide) nucleotide adenylyltransferase [Candidatus Zixiibacteriota bacterium]|nr:nicotinate (nicotinamide) nucleotide adenylyltransferase [Bacteroidales bacterium]RKX27816.1 MAG: nicotinate (nicotinamide) nucleotide adenylyltransferase [candidate division Zixibacteria bacterium]